jgi:nicotinate-nucleotide adenylyltransferase
MKTIGIFGGAFDPPHIGHEYIVRESLKTVDMIIFYLTYIHPMGKKMSHIMERREMCRLSFGSTPRVPKYIDRGRRIYARDIMRIFNESTPNQVVIIGNDELVNLHRWYKYEQLVQENQFLVVPLLNDKHEQKISSSVIRTNVDKYKKFLNKDVYKYIKENGLYKK